MPTIYRSGSFDHIDWQVPIEHFLWDRLIEAHRDASGMSVGAWAEYLPWYRMIEAEWLIRTRGEMQTVNDWLRVEFIAEEIGETSDLTSAIEAICVETAHMFSVEERPEILLSVLSIESDAPWVDARAGYFIDKYPYDKICIPHYSVSRPDLLREVVGHEYTHALNLALTQAKCPIWLNEALAMLSQTALDQRALSDFRSGRATWKSPRELDQGFAAERRGDGQHRVIFLAYEQAAWIGRYLLTLGDRAKLGDLMRAFNDNSFLGELKMRLTSETPADEALRQTYGLGEDEVFAQALDWVRRP